MKYQIADSFTLPFSDIYYTKEIDDNDFKVVSQKDKQCTLDKNNLVTTEKIFTV